MHLVLTSLASGKEKHVIREATRLYIMLLGEEDPRTHEECNDHHAKRTSLGYGRLLSPLPPEIGANLERDPHMTEVCQISIQHGKRKSGAGENFGENRSVNLIETLVNV